MRRLLFFHDFTSPFCRVAAQLAGDVATRAGLQLRAVPFELYPAPGPLPGPGQPSQEELAAAQSAADEWEFDLGRLGRVPRTRKAHEAVAFARKHGAAQTLVREIYEALWQRDLDISRLDVLARLGEEAGLDGEALHVALGTDVFEAEVLGEQNAAASAGLTGVPAFQVGDQMAVGLFSTAELLDWIESVR